MPSKNFNEDVEKARRAVSQSGSTNTSSNVSGSSTGNTSASVGSSLNTSTGGARIEEARQYVSSVGSQGVNASSTTNIMSTSSTLANVSSSNINDQNLQEARKYVDKTKTKQ